MWVKSLPVAGAGRWARPDARIVQVHTLGPVENGLVLVPTSRTIPFAVVARKAEGVRHQVTTVHVIAPALSAWKLRALMQIVISRSSMPMP